MSQEFDAVCSNGHLVPLEPIKLEENERVRVRVTAPPTTTESPRKLDLSGMSLHDALVVTGLLGAIQGGPPELSTNPSFMEGFGEEELDPC